MAPTTSNVPAKSPVFEGHFPSYPILPGVMILETMNHAAGWLMLGAVPAAFAGVLFVHHQSGLGIAAFDQPCHIARLHGAHAARNAGAHADAQWNGPEVARFGGFQQIGADRHGRRRPDQAE